MPGSNYAADNFDTSNTAEVFFFLNCTSEDNFYSK